jgi:putative acetyltransferase
MHEIIRAYAPQDTDALVKIWERANALAHTFLAPAFVAQVKRDMREIYLPNAETWVLLDHGSPVGFVAMIGAEIGGLFLNPAFHGRGIGKVMTNHVAAPHGPLRVEAFVENEIGRRFYERCEFVRTADYLHEPSGRMTAKMAMSGAA